MSKDITVLAPNGRRQIIHCTPDTSILHILEEVCAKHGYQPSDYDLKHHNHLLDLTSTIRFTNLPNKATIEMVEADKKRVEANVTIGLLLEDGDRRTADFPPNTLLYDLITSLAPSEFKTIENPTILYMRQEVIGINALRAKSLRQLGLIKGRAILRLLSKADEAKQANVSSVYRVPISEKITENNEVPSPHAGPSGKGFDPVAVIKEQKKERLMIHDDVEMTSNEENSKPARIAEPKPKIQPPSHNLKINTPSETSLTEENLQRRLNIEEEVTFIGDQKAVVYMQPDEQNDFPDLPDDFYDLTVEEVRRLYRDLQQERESLENMPLLTTTKKDETDKAKSDESLSVYKNAVVRIQFPDGMILQGVFQPTNTIQDITNFVKGHLVSPKPFKIFTAIKDSLKPKMTLKEARFVPCVHMHFKWLDESQESGYLKPDIYSKRTSSDAASLLASKYRAPMRRKIEAPQTSAPSTSKNSKVPRWFKS